MIGSRPDFLSRIAAKAVGAAPLVEPRLPSRFEARREAADEFPRSCEEPVEAAVDAEPSGSASPPRRPRVEAVASETRPIGRETAATAGEARPPRPRGTETGTPPPSAAPPPPPAQAPAAPLAQPAPAPARAEMPPAAPDRPRPLLVPPPETGAADRSEGAIARRPASEPVVPAARERDRASRPAPEAAASDAPPPVAREAPAPAARPQSPALDLAVRMPEIRPRPTRGEIRAVEHSPPRPVVNITIGRIEVRANAAAAAPPTRRTPPPRPAPQSLADYLERRGGAR